MPDTHAPQQLEPWQWSEEHWRKLVAQVRAGKRYRPKAWKDGARCAVALSFDSDHETNELRDGGKSIGRMCWGQYANRVGVPRIRALLEKHDVKATSYTPATDAFETFRRELDAAWEEGGIFQLTMHPHIIGYRSRIWIVDELIRHAKSKGQGKDAVWFATHEQVARYAKEHAA